LKWDIRKKYMNDALILYKLPITNTIV
jgi:hypothetical protein